MTFADLNLPYSYGHGVWTRSQAVTGEDWTTAEDALTQEALTWIGDNPGKANGYHIFRNEPGKMLTLDLMRGA